MEQIPVEGLTGPVVLPKERIGNSTFMGIRTFEACVEARHPIRAGSRSDKARTINDPVRP